MADHCGTRWVRISIPRGVVGAALGFVTSQSDPHIWHLLRFNLGQRDQAVHAVRRERVIGVSRDQGVV